MSKHTEGPYEVVRTALKRLGLEHCKGADGYSNVTYDLVNARVATPEEAWANCQLWQAAPAMFDAIEEADTLIVLLAMCDDLKTSITPQAFSQFKKARIAIQDARAKAKPNGAYAAAVKEVREKERCAK